MSSSTTPLKAHEDPAHPRAERIALLRYDYAAQPKAERGDCDLCGGEQVTVITHRDRYGFSAQAVACNRCGLTVLSPRMTAEAYGHFYQGVYRPLVSAYHGRRIDASTVKDEQIVYAAEIAQLLGPHLTGDRRRSFLDVGGSTGVVAAELARRFGLQATVLDPAPSELAEAQRLGLETIAGFVETWDPGDRRFDVVGLFQTIDHLLDVSSTLTKIRSLLRDDGLFVVDIVDFRAAYLKNWSIEAAVKIDHPYYFTEQTAEAYLARVGFAVQRKAYSADHHLVAYVCAKANPVETLPSAEDVYAFFREIRYVQNAPRAGVR